MDVFLLGRKIGTASQYENKEFGKITYIDFEPLDYIGLQSVDDLHVDYFNQTIVGNNGNEEIFRTDMMKIVNDLR
tara:strand:+ start:116 stop:340 length:225 start_codon:yes stop_codon:yes gene_type:complete